MQTESPAMSGRLDRAALAAWYLCPGHRVLWQLPLALGLAIGLALVIMRVDAGDPQANYAESKKRLLELAPPPMADEHNAAFLLNKAFAAFPVYAAGATEDIESRLGHYLPEMWDDPNVAAEFAALQPSLLDLLSAAKLERSHWYLDYSKGFGILLPHLVQLRRAARVLALDALWHARAGDHKSAAQRLQAIHRLARFAETDPILVNGLVAVAMDGIADQALQQIVDFHTPGQLEDVRAYRAAIFVERQPMERAARMLDGESRFGMYTFDGLFSMNVSPAAAGLGIPVPRAGGVWSIWYGSERQAMENIYGFMLAKLQAGKRIEPGTVDRLLNEQSNGPTALTRLLIPVIERFADSYIRSADQALAAETALAVLEFRIEHGRDPERIEDLAPQYLERVPTDSINGMPLRWRTDPLGFVRQFPNAPEEPPLHPGLLRIYGVGADGHDDGGYNHWSNEHVPEAAIQKLKMSVKPTLNNSIAPADDSVFRLPPAKPEQPPAEELRE